MQRVRRHGLEDEMRTMLAEYAVRVVLTSHPTQFYPGNVLGHHHGFGRGDGGQRPW